MAKINLKQMMLGVRKAKQEITRLEKYVDSKKRILEKYFNKTGNTKFEYEGVSGYMSERVAVTYNIADIKENIDQDLWNNFVKKRAMILDYRRFFRLCKKNGINPKLFKDVLQIEEYVDEKELNKMYEVGEITLNDLEGCYETTSKTSIGFRVN